MSVARGVQAMDQTSARDGNHLSDGWVGFQFDHLFGLFGCAKRIPLASEWDGLNSRSFHSTLLKGKQLTDFLRSNQMNWKTLLIEKINFVFQLLI